MAKYRLLGGEHTTSKWVPATKEEAQLTDMKTPCMKDEITGEWKKLEKASYYPGDVIESDKDLIKMFGRNKFELVTDDTPLRRGGPSLRELLERLTIPQLKEFATEREISLDGSSKKPEMIESLVSALEAAPV